MAAGVRVHLRVEHEHQHVRAVLQHHFGDILEADVAHGTVTTDGPDLWHLPDFIISHHGVVEVGQLKIFAVRTDVVVAGE